MPNPLFNAMSKITNAGNLTGNNPLAMVGQIQQMMKSGNPEQMALQMLQQKNPQAAQQVQAMMNGGQNPQQILNSMMAQMNPNQANQMKQLMGMFGGVKK